MTLEEARAFRAGKACAICGAREDQGARLNVDHCHRDGHIRGVLCRDCNLGLGRFGDDQTRLAAAIRYLQG